MATCGHLFWTLLAFFDLQVTRCFLPSFKSISLSLKKKREIDCQDGHHCRHLGFRVGTILAILIYKSPRCFLPSLNSGGFLVQEKKPKIDFQDSRHSEQVLSILNLQVTPMLPTKVWVNWPFGSEEQPKNSFSRWRPSWISDRNDFSCFWSTSHPDASNLVSSQLTQGCRRSRLLKQLLTPHDGRRTTDID